MNLAIHCSGVIANVAAGIPYRTDSGVATGSLMSAVLITLLVLGAIIAGLLLARRYGWLRFRGGVPQATTGPHEKPWRVTARVRLSATARAFVLESKDASYLVVESSQHVAVQPQSRASGDVHASNE